MNIIPNPNTALYEAISADVKRNGNYCPCAIEKTEATKCVCEEFRRQETEGECHCGRFVKVKEGSD